MSPDAIELALDSHEDELSRTAIDIGMLARRVEYLEAVQVKLLDLLQLVLDFGDPAEGEKSKAAYQNILDEIRTEKPEIETNELLTAEKKKVEPPPPPKA